MRTVYFVIGLFVFSSSCFANQGLNPSANYGFGLTGGFLTGTGMTFRKYFHDNYIQVGGLGSFYAKGDKNNDGSYDWNLSLVAGRYFNKTYFKGAGFPVGFQAFYGIHDTYEKYTRDDYDYNLALGQTYFHQLLTGVGFGVDFFNPATKGIGWWFTVSYDLVFNLAQDNAQLERTSFYNSIGVNYNW